MFSALNGAEENTIASRSLGTLTLDVVAKIGGFEQGMEKASRVAKQRSKDIEDSISSAVSVSLGVLGGLGAAAATAFAALNSVAESVAAYQDLADQMGVASEAIAGMQLAADLSGVSLDTVAAASVRLTSSLSKTDDESKAVGKALAALNIPIAEFKRLDPVSQLERVAQEMANYGAGAGKTAVAVDLFGKSGAALIPIMNDMAEVGVRNSRLTQDQIDAADRLTKEWARQKSVITDLGKSLLVDLIPPLVRATNAAMDAVKQFGFVGALQFNMGRNPFANRLTEISDAQAKVTAAQKEMESFKPTGRFFGLDDKKLASLRETVALREKELGYLKREYGLTSQAGAGRGVAQIKPLQLDYSTATTTPPRNPRSASVPKMSTAIDEAQRYIEGLQKQLERVQDLTVSEQVLKDIQLGRLGLVTEAQKVEILGIAQQIDQMKAMEEQRKTETKTLEEQRRARETMLDEGRRLYEETRTPLEKFNASQDRLNTLLESGAIDFVTAARAGEIYKKTLDESTKVVSEMDTFAQKAAASIQDAIGDGLVDIMEGNFDDIGKSFGKMLTRIAADAVAADIARKLFGASVKGGEGEGWLGGLLSLFGSSFGGMRANGGPVMPHTLYRVNERGPEMFEMSNGNQMMLTGASGGRVHSNESLGGSLVQNITVNVPQTSTRQSGAQLAGEMERKLAQARRNR